LTLHATQTHICHEPPVTGARRVSGRCLRLPDTTGRRQAEGGLRLHGKFKKRGSGAHPPLVSVVTVCLNAGATLEQAIRSVLAQTHENIEYIVIDGGSGDDTPALLREYEAAIDYYVSEPDAGLYDAMNKGLAAAGGDYIMILNADDWYAGHCIESLLRVRSVWQTDVASALACYVDGGGRRLKVFGHAPFDESTRLRMPLRHESMLVPAGIYERLGGYDAGYRIVADFDFTVRLFEAGCRLAETQEPLLFFRNTGISNTDMQKLTAERFQLIKKQFPFMEDGDAMTLAGTIRKVHLREMFEKYRGRPQLVEALLAFGKRMDLDAMQAEAPSAAAPVEVRLGGMKCGQSAGITAKSSTAPGIGAHPDAAAARPEAVQPLPGGKIRVLTFCSLDHGGAGTGTQRRVAALREQGVDAKILSLLVKSPHDYVIRYSPGAAADRAGDPEFLWQEVVDRAIRPARAAPGYCASELFSLTDSVMDYREIADLLAESDIVHLHWVVGMIDYERAGDYLGDKPVVWTLADMNAFTGGCHYSEGCEEYKRECRQCPLLGPESDLAHKTWHIKKKAYSRLGNLHIVCPSAWLAGRVRESALLGDRPIHVIDNAFPADRYMPVNRSVARIRLGLPLHKRLILFGAENVANRRKGADLLKAAIDEYCSLYGGADTEVVVFGYSSMELALPVHELGYVAEEHRLAVAYSAADVFVLPSREDNAPLTVGESLLCGTPVVSFPVGNVPDIVRHRATGYIARHLDPVDMAHGIKWALDETAAGDGIRVASRCRQTAVAFHSSSKAARRHISLYNHMLRGLDSVRAPHGNPIRTDRARAGKGTE
jgi:glycosyltransferase involved in cell wall biosynthesis